MGRIPKTSAGTLIPLIIAANSGDKEAEAGMMDFFRKAATGQPMSRREFLRGSGQAAAAAGAARVPVPLGVARAAQAAQRLDPKAMLPPAFDAGFALPNTGEEILMLDGDAVMHGSDYLGNLTEEQMQTNRAILERARASMPPATDRPLWFNHMTNQWHEKALRDPVLGEADPESWSSVFLKAGERAPDQHNLMLTEEYLPEDFIASAYESGTLKAGNAFGGPNLIDGYERDWWQERRGLLDYEMRKHGNNDAKQMARSKEGRRLLTEKGMAPGARHNLGKNPLQSDASQLTGNMGLLGDMPTERIGRIRNLLSMGVPATLAIAASQQASAGEPQGFQPNPDDPTKFFIPQGVDATPAADPSVERAIIPSEPFPDYAAQELRRAQDAYVAANRAFESSTMYGETARARADELAQAGVDPSVAEMRALQEMEFQRPTISAQYYKSVVGDWPLDASGEVPDFVSPAALAKGMSIGVAVQNAMTGGGAYTPEQVYDAISKVATNNPEELDRGLAAVGVRGRESLLDAMNAHAPEGDWSDTSGVTDEEFAGMQDKYGMNANFMYPERMRANFDALRQYELFAAGTPRYEPGRNMIQMAGDFLDAGNPTRGMVGRPQDGAPVQSAPSYVSQFWTPQTTWDAKNAVYWYRQSQPDLQRAEAMDSGYEPDAAKDGYFFFRNPADNSARYYRHSTLYPTGLDRGVTEDTSRLHGRLSAYTLPYTQTPFTGDKGYITDVNLRTKRPVPIRPAHWRPEDVLSNQQAVQQYEQASNDYAQASAAGYLGANPTPFASGMMNLPRWAGDASTVADVAISGGLGSAVGAMSKAPIRGAIRGASMPAVGEAMSQIGYTTGLGTAVTPSMTDYMFKSAPNNTLQEVDPAHPRYWQRFRKKWEGEVEALDRAAKDEQTRRAVYSPAQ